MINSYTVTNQAIAADGVLSFDNTRILTGCTVKHADGTATFTLTKPGYYYITFNAVVNSATPGKVSAQLLNGSEPVPGAVSSVTTATANDPYPLMFATIIRVLPSCCAVDNTTNLTIINSDIAANYTTANINITKLC